MLVVSLFCSHYIVQSAFILHITSASLKLKNDTFNVKAS